MSGFDRDAFAELCDQQPGSVREQPFGPHADVWKVGGKMFALSTRGQQPARANLKCDPGMAMDLRATWPDHVLPGYHMNKRHWNTIVLDGELPAELVEGMIEDSWDLVCESLPAALRTALQASGE